MTTSQIENAANRGDTATADFPIQLVLRSNCIPAFLEDAGRIGWRTKTFLLSTVVGQQAYKLPPDFFEVAEVYLPPDTSSGSHRTLSFIG